MAWKEMNAFRADTLLLQPERDACKRAARQARSFIHHGELHIRLCEMISDEIRLRFDLALEGMAYRPQADRRRGAQRSSNQSAKTKTDAPDADDASVWPEA